MLNANAKNTRTATTAIACALAAALSLSPAVVYASPANLTQPARATAAKTIYIGKDKALKIALKDAGVSKEQCRYIDVGLDRDLDERVHYDVDFKIGDLEHEYDIDAVTGKILSHDVEVDD